MQPKITLLEGSFKKEVIFSICFIEIVFTYLFIHLKRRGIYFAQIKLLQFKTDVDPCKAPEM